jgi:hypothetical protein
MTGLMTGAVIVLSWEIGVGLRLSGKNFLPAEVVEDCKFITAYFIVVLGILVAVLNLVFGGVSVVEVRFRGSLSARSAIGYLVDSQPPVSLSAPQRHLVFPSTTTKLQSSNVRFSLFSSCFLPFLVQAVPGALDLPFACFIDALLCCCLFFLLKWVHSDERLSDHVGDQVLAIVFFFCCCRQR